jgi:hypothetical protein
MPAPAQTGSFETAGRQAILEIGSANVDTRVMDPQAHEFFRRKLLIEAMRTLGNVRTIYDSYPTTGGDRAMNGNSLLLRADQEEQKLDRDIMNWPFGTNFIAG